MVERDSEHLLGDGSGVSGDEHFGGMPGVHGSVDESSDGVEDLEEDRSSHGRFAMQERLQGNEAQGDSLLIEHLDGFIAVTASQCHTLLHNLNRTLLPPRFPDRRAPFPRHCWLCSQASWLHDSRLHDTDCSNLNYSFRSWRRFLDCCDCKTFWSDQFSTCSRIFIFHLIPSVNVLGLLGFGTLVDLILNRTLKHNHVYHAYSAES